MAGIFEISSALLSRSLAEAEMAAQNMANMTTPGYRARHLFSEALAGRPADVNPSFQGQTVDFTTGKTVETGNPLDLAILGDGFFRVRVGDAIHFTRAGQFSRDAQGRVVTASGAILQSTTGDVVTSSANLTLTADGVVLDDGEPVARLSLARFDDVSVLRPAGAGLFEAAEGADRDVASPRIQAGSVETSNVSTGSEMLGLMAAMRRAESGQKLIQLYDDLLSRALTAFEQA